MSEPTARALPAGRVMVDASFLIALLEGEEAAQAHAGVLPRAVVSAVTLGEVYAELYQRAGVEAATIEEALRALGVALVDLPVAAAAHLPAVAAAETAHCAHQHTAGGEEAAALSMADLAVLAHAIAAGLPLLTGNQHWAALTEHGLDVEAHLYREGTAAVMCAPHAAVSPRCALPTARGLSSRPLPASAGGGRAERQCSAPPPDPAAGSTNPVPRAG